MQENQNNKTTPDGKNIPPKGPKFNIYWIYGIIVSIVLLMLLFGNNNFNASSDTHSF
jgi:hypothetical protein